MSGGGKSKEVTVGYHYYMNMHFSLAHGGVDELLEIRVGDRTAWAGSLTSGTAMVNQPTLFGGEKREGGVLGFADFMPGDQNQPVNPSLRSAIARATGQTDIPAYRGLSTIFFKGFDNVDVTGTPWETTHKGTADTTSSLPSSFNVKDVLSYLTQISKWKKLARSAFLWSSMNPYFKPPAFLVRRVWKGWYPEKAQIGDHVNPIHIIYECLTNKVWGLGYPTQDIDDASFRAAADKVYSEGFGLSLKWTNQTRVQEFIDLIRSHINANLVEDRQTGLWRMIMVRDDYDASSLFELNESNCILETFQRKTLGETINEVTVAYTRPEDGSTDTVTVQDLANFSNSGQINSQKKEYPGINDPELAFKVALRDLNTLSKPVAKFSIRCNRDIIGHYPGDVVRINWPSLGLNGVVIRIGTMNLGNLQKGEIQVEAIEDVFALPQSSYVSQQPIGWVDPAKTPEPVSERKLYELSYYELQTSTTSADRADWPVDVGFVAVSAKAPNTDATTLALYDNVSGEITANGEFTPQLQLTSSVGHMDTTLPVDFSRVDPLVMIEGGLAWLGDELVEITGLDTGNGTVTVNRSLLDTVPAKHAAGEKLWFYQASNFVLDTEVRVDGETVDYKLLTETSKGQLDPDQAPIVSFQLTGRAQKPYPPGNLKTQGDYFPSVVSGDSGPLSLSWSHRDRTQQLALDHTLFTDEDVGDGTGLNYKLTVENERSSVIFDAFLGSAGVYNYVNEATELNEPVDKPDTLYRRTKVLSDNGQPLFIGGAINGVPYVFRPIQFDDVTGNIEIVREYRTVNGQTLYESGQWETERLPFNISGKSFIFNGELYSGQFQLDITTGTLDHWSVSPVDPGVFTKIAASGVKTELTLAWKDSEEVKGTFTANNQVVSFSQTNSSVPKNTLPPSAPNQVIAPLGDSTGDRIEAVTVTDTHVVATTWGRILSVAIGSEAGTWSVVHTAAFGTALQTLDHGAGGIVSSGLQDGVGKLWLSSDGGSTWSEIGTGKDYTNAFWHGSRLFAIGESFIDYSDDNGATWSPATVNGSESPRFVRPLKNMTSLVVIGSKGDNSSDQYGSTVYTSADNGATWNMSFGGPIGSAIFTGAQQGADWVLFGRKDSSAVAHTWILVSSDTGANWVELTDVYDGFLGAVSDCCVVGGYWFAVYTNTVSQSLFLRAPVGASDKLDFEEAGGNLNYRADLVDLVGSSLIALGSVDESGYEDLTTNTINFQSWVRTSNDLVNWSTPTETPLMPVDSLDYYAIRTGFNLAKPTGHLVFANGYYYTGHRGARIYRSSDLVNWEACDTPGVRLSTSTYEHVRVILSDGATVVALVYTGVAGGEGYETYDDIEVWTSTDGLSFTKTYGHVWDVNAAKTHDQGLVTDNGFAFFGHRGLLVSEDGGLTWHLRVTANVPFALFSNSTLLWMQGDYELSGVLKYSMDYGVTQSDAKPDDLISFEVVDPPAELRYNDRLKYKLDVFENGVSGYQAHEHEFKRAGYGYRYGEFYGGTN